MKPVFALLVILLISCSGEVINRTPSSVPEKKSERVDFQGVKKKILILTLANETHYESEKLGEMVTDHLITQLDLSNRFILNPKVSDNVVTSKEIYSSGGTKLSEIGQAAKNLGIYLIVFGRILDANVAEKSNEIGVLSHTSMATNAALEIKVYDVFSGHEILSEKTSGSDDSSTFRKFSSEDDSYKEFRDENLSKGLYKAVEKVSPKIIALADRLNWQGRVAKIDGQNIYLNSGRLSGLKIGDVLSVVTEGSEVFDPQTGAQIGISRGIVKATIEVVDYFGDDGALANLLSGGTIHEGDRVEIY